MIGSYIAALVGLTILSVIACTIGYKAGYSSGISDQSRRHDHEERDRQVLFNTFIDELEVAVIHAQQGVTRIKTLVEEEKELR